MKNVLLFLCLAFPLFADQILESQTLARESNPANHKQMETQDDFPSYWDGWQWLARIGGSYTFLSQDVNLTTIDTTQPIWITPESYKNTVFFQINGLLQGREHTIDTGLGYRYLLDQNWLFGVNGFYNTRTDFSVQSFSLGADIQTKWISLYGNYYQGTSGWVTVNSNDGIIDQQRALTGGDLYVSFPLPYMPWFRTEVGYVHWSPKDDNDINGYTISGEINIAGPLSIDGGTIRTNEGNENYFTIKLRLGNPNRIQFNLIKDRFNKGAFPARNLRRYLLQPVGREKRVVYEATEFGGNGVSVGRGN